MIGQLLALVGGIAGGYALGKKSSSLIPATSEAPKALGPRPAPSRATGTIPGSERLPSDEQVTLPEDREDFERLNEAVCVCLGALVDRGDLAPVPPEVLRDCVLEAIFPDFPWPPVAGDVPQAEVLWRIVDHEARRATHLRGTCPAPSSGPGSSAEAPKGPGHPEPEDKERTTSHAF